MSFCGLLLTYGLNTWLPEIMGQHGYGKTYSLTFLLALNAGAVIGGLVASRSADRFGPKAIVSTTFVIAAVSLVLLTLNFPLPVLLTSVAFAGVGSLGNPGPCLRLRLQLLPHPVPHGRRGLVRRLWPARRHRRSAGGRLPDQRPCTRAMSAFLVFAGVALAGGLVTVFVRQHRAAPEAIPSPELSSVQAMAGRPVESSGREGAREVAAQGSGH